MNAVIAFKPARISTKRLVNAVDELARINASISRLQAEAETHKELLKSSGVDEVLGTMHRAAIITCTSARLDVQQVRKLLTPAALDTCTVESTSTKVCLYDL